MDQFNLIDQTDDFLPETRAEAWDSIASLDPHESGWETKLSALTMVLVDSLLAVDSTSLEALADPIRDRLAQLHDTGGPAQEMRGWLKAWLATARWALQRLPSTEEIALRQNSQAWCFLVELSGEPMLTSTKLRERLNTGESQISRVGRELRASGLVAQRRAGRTAIWEMTPRGRQLVHKLKSEEAHVRQIRPRSTGRNGRRRAGTASAGRSASSRMLKTDVRQASYQDTGRERFVVPHSKGGWAVAASAKGRALARHETKNEAMRHAKELLAKAGGGQVIPADKQGHLGRSITIRARTPTS